ETRVPCEELLENVLGVVRLLEHLDELIVIAQQVDTPTHDPDTTRGVCSRRHGSCGVNPCQSQARGATQQTGTTSSRPAPGGRCRCATSARGCLSRPTATPILVERVRPPNPQVPCYQPTKRGEYCGRRDGSSMEAAAARI